jgi:hypothetical protein
VCAHLTVALPRDLVDDPKGALADEVTLDVVVEVGQALERHGWPAGHLWRLLLARRRRRVGGRERGRMGGGGGCVLFWALEGRAAGLAGWLVDGCR